MKVVVKKEFRDVSDFNLVHHVGEVLEVDEARAHKLASLGLVTIDGEDEGGEEGGGGEGGGGSVVGINVKFENIKDSNNLPTNKYKMRFINKE